MGFIGLKVPHETARLIEGLEYPGTPQGASSMHVTILYLGKDLPIETVAQAMIATCNVAAKIHPFICGVKDVASFPVNPDDGVPIILPVLSQTLHEFRAALINEFIVQKVPFSNKYPDYKPHISVAFVKDGSMDTYEAPLPSPLTWTASDVVIWGGNKNDELVSVVVPFSIRSVDRIAQRIASGC